MPRPSPAPAPRATRVGTWVVVGWSLALAVLALGPALGRGYVLSYDMVWVPDLHLGDDALGLASGLPRAVPSDAVVALLDQVVPGMVLQKVVLVLVLCAGGIGATRLVPDHPLTVRLLVVGLYQWNALVAERLVLGAWPVLAAYAALPWTIRAAQRWRDGTGPPWPLLVLVPIGSLSASAGLATAVAVLAFGASRRRWAPALLVVLAADAPWVVSGLLHHAAATSDPAAARVFALHGEGHVPGPLAALTLGGVWNAEVVPDSRTGLLGWVVLVAVVGLAIVGLRSWWWHTARRDTRGYLVCWAVGQGLALLSWAAPGAIGWAAGHVPGGGVLRDGSRLLVLAAPLTVVLAAEGARVVWSAGPRQRLARASLALAAVLLPVALLPDLAWGAGGQLRSADYPASYAAARALLDEVPPGDVLVLPESSYRQPVWNHGHKVLDPLGRYLGRDYLASDVLLVSRTVVAGEDPRWRAAVVALGGPTPQARSVALGALGVSAVVVDPTAPGPAPTVTGRVVLSRPDLLLIALPAHTTRVVPRSWWVAMTGAWSADALLVFLGSTGALLSFRRPREG